MPKQPSREINYLITKASAIEQVTRENTRYNYDKGFQDGAMFVCAIALVLMILATFIWGL